MSLPNDAGMSDLAPPPRVCLGTSSWTFEGWRGVFYPDGLKREAYLAEYAKHFGGVEVNTTFYGLPDPSTLIRWVESVPPGFRFALKFPREITHERRLADVAAPTFAFFDVIDALGEAAGPALLQLPPTFSRARDGRTLAGYLDWLAANRDGRAIAVEVRAVDLMTEAFARFVDERQMALVLVDRVDTPDGFDAWLGVNQQAPFAYIRWIGDDRNGPKGDAEIVAPQDARLQLWATRIAALHEQGRAVFGFMHNPYEGHSPESVRRLVQLLADLGVDAAWSPPLWSGGGDDDEDMDGNTGAEDDGAQLRLL